MDLTQEQILTEPAGGQMDNWIAEYVMEWKSGNISTANPPGSNLEVWRTDDWKTQIWKITWHPSTDIAAAWGVEERIKELGLVDKYVQELNEIVNMAWENDVRLTQRWQLAHADPLERCRAALLTIFSTTAERIEKNENRG